MRSILYSFIFISIYLLLGISLNACQSLSQEGKASHKDFEFESVGYKYFEMDSLSHPNYFDAFVYDEDSKSYYTLNRAPKENYIFYIFDEKSGKIKNKVSVPKEGANSVEGISSFFIFSNGVRPILGLYSEALSYIYFIDWQKGARKTLKLPRDYESITFDADFFPPVPRISNILGAYLLDGKIHTTGYIMGEYENETESNRPFTCTIDTTTGKIEYGLCYPKLYQEGHWGGVHFRQPSMTYIPSKDEFIYNLPADNHLYVQKRNSKEHRKVYAGSRNFEQPKPPFKLSKNADLPNMAQTSKALAITPMFAGVRYDPYNHLIYRITIFPYRAYQPSEEQHPIGYLKCSIIVLNENYEVLGEKELDEKIYGWDIIVSPEGLLIGTKAQEEDKLTYEIFKPRLAP